MERQEASPPGTSFLSLSLHRLKKAQWGSSGAASEPLVPREAGCRFPSTTEHHHLEEERATYPQEEDHFLPPGRAQVWLERNLVG